MKIRTIATLTGALALTLAACGDDGNDDASAAAEASATATATEMSSTEMSDQMSSTEMSDQMTGEAPSDASEPGTIVDVAAANDDFSTLVAAVQAAGLVDTLSGPGPFTVFAPTNEAFDKALDALGLTADELLADTETLTSILTYHVIAGEVPSSAVVTMDGQTAATVNGADVTISVDGDTVMVNDATVTAVDIPASNGVIHVIDTVLLPPAG